MGATLFVYAAPVEAGGLAQRPDMLALGVGKTAAALSLALRLSSDDPPAAVVAFGFAGAYPGGPEVGALVVVDRDVLADEGVQTPDGFSTLADLGLPAQTSVRADEALSARVAALLRVRRVAGATVSTCSGTDALASERLASSGAAVESMEGAAIGLVCARLGVPFTQLRAISNRTGDRERAGWDLADAADKVQAAVARLTAELSA